MESLPFKIEFFEDMRSTDTSSYLQEIQQFSGSFFEKSQNIEDRPFFEVAKNVILSEIVKVMNTMLPLFQQKNLMEPVSFYVRTWSSNDNYVYKNYHPRHNATHSIIISGSLLQDLFKVYFQEKQELELGNKHIFYRTFLQLLDFEQYDVDLNVKDYGLKLDHFYDPVITYFLDFRKAGLFNFPKLLLGGNLKYKSLQDALIGFNDYINNEILTVSNLSEKMLFELIILRVHIKNIEDKRGDIGIWLLLDLLKNKHPKVGNLIDKIESGKLLDAKEFVYISQLGLKLDNQAFIDQFRETDNFFTEEIYQAIIKFPVW